MLQRAYRYGIYTLAVAIVCAAVVALSNVVVTVVVVVNSTVSAYGDAPYVATE